MLRNDADVIIEKSIAAVLPDAAVEKALSGKDFGSGKVYLVSIGKSAWQMAKAADRIMGSRIDGGVVITKYDHVKGPIANYKLIEAGHNA